MAKGPTKDKPGFVIEAAALDAAGFGADRGLQQQGRDPAETFFSGIEKAHVTAPRCSLWPYGRKPTKPRNLCAEQRGVRSG